MSNVDLIEELAEFSSDPLGFVHFAFPWGESGELEDATGPEGWQRDVLQDVADGLLSIEDAVQIAVTSGHGIGKSALVAWLILWAISTFEDTKGVVTANTEVQLKTKTWAELAKWYRLFIGREYFNMTATAIFSADPEHARTWRVDMIPWSERNPEAFAGLHNKHRRILVIFDEASAIDDLIHETTEGALTDQDTQIIFAQFGNPTKNTGRFRDCFPGGKFAHRWTTRAVDSRTVSLTNKTQIAKWITDYGEDHDFVRVRVLGKFPRIDATSFISLDVAREAAQRTVLKQMGQPVVLGVDVGRFGDDPSVIYPRCGRDASSRTIEIYPQIDTMSLAGKVAAAYLRHHASMVMIDSGGVGGGVVDRLRQLRIPVMEVDFGSKPDGTNLDDGAKYANKRAEIWGATRTWLLTGSIPDSIPGNETPLTDELTGPSYGMNVREAIQLESKKEMRRRGVASPNVADALACTFAYNVFVPQRYIDSITMQQPNVVDDYNPFEQKRIYG